jgi:hypothetical protein
MGSYLQQYGVEDERRSRVIKWIVVTGIIVLVALLAGYLLLRNYPEKRVVKRFLDQLNARDYQAAYRDWGCTTQQPCPNYDYHRFMEDWGPSRKISSPWKIASIDGCKTFVTVNVQAQGSELQSLSVQRNNRSLGFAPAPECQERQWRWKQFFQRIFGGGRS